MDASTEFQQNIIRALRATLRRVRANAQPTPPEALARRALYLLKEYAFDYPDAWPVTSELLLALAPKLEQAGYRATWMELVHLGIIQSSDLSDWETHAELQLHLGHLHRLMGHVVEAESYLHASANYFAEQTDASKQAQALNQLSYLARDHLHYEEAERLAQQALALAEGSPSGRAMSLSALGLIALEQHRYAAAEGYLREALQIREALGARREIAWSLQNLGIVMREQGDYEQARDLLAAATVILADVKDLAHQAIVQMNLAGTYDLLQEPQKALRILAEAQPVLRSLSDDLNYAKLLTNQGLVHLSLGNYEEAELAFAQSAERFDQLEIPSWALNARDGMGITFLERHWYPRALALFLEIKKDLPLIKGTQPYKYLVETIDQQIEQAQTQNVIKGTSRYRPKRRRNQ